MRFRYLILSFPLLLCFSAIVYFYYAENDSVENLLFEKSNSVNSVKELELSGSQPVRSLTSNAQSANRERVLAAKSNSARDTRSDSGISEEVLRDDGTNYLDYVTQLVLLLFIKMVHENTEAGLLENKQFKPHFPEISKVLQTERT